MGQVLCDSQMLDLIQGVLMHLTWMFVKDLSVQVTLKNKQFKLGSLGQK